MLSGVFAYDGGDDRVVQFHMIYINMCAMCIYTDIICQMPLSKSKPNFNKVQLTIMYHGVCMCVWELWLIKCPLNTFFFRSWSPLSSAFKGIFWSSEINKPKIKRDREPKKNMGNILNSIKKHSPHAQCVSNRKSSMKMILWFSNWKALKNILKKYLDDVPPPNIFHIVFELVGWHYGVSQSNIQPLNCFN